MTTRRAARDWRVPHRAASEAIGVPLSSANAGYAKAEGIPLVHCQAGERKHELAEEYLAKTQITQGLFLILVGRAQAPVNQKQALGDLGLCQVFFGQFMLTLPGLTMHKGNALSFRIPVKPAAEATRHAHEVCVVQSVVRSGQPLPPHTEAASCMPYPEISIQHDPVRAIVAAAQQFCIPIAQ